MYLEPWFEWNKERLELELQALRTRGAAYRIREDLRQSDRVIEVEIDWPLDGRVVRLRVVFPDTYPYFRPEVWSTDLRLARHQAPFDGALCLIGRSTINWDYDRTVADLLAEQLPELLKAGAVTDAKELAQREGEQAEPVTDYYTPFFQPAAAMLVDPPARLQELTGDTRGRLVVGLRDQMGQGAVLEVFDDHGKRLSAIDRCVAELYPRRVRGRWVWLPSAPDPDSERLEAKVRELHPRALPPPAGWESFGQGKRIDVLGLVFPEEVRPGETADGWAFYVRTRS